MKATLAIGACLVALLGLGEGLVAGDELVGRLPGPVVCGGDPQLLINVQLAITRAHGHYVAKNVLLRKRPGRSAGLLKEHLEKVADKAIEKELKKVRKEEKSAGDRVELAMRLLDLQRCLDSQAAIIIQAHVDQYRRSNPRVQEQEAEWAAYVDCVGQRFAPSRGKRQAIAEAVAAPDESRLAGPLPGGGCDSFAVNGAVLDCLPEGVKEHACNGLRDEGGSAYFHCDGNIAT